MPIMNVFYEKNSVCLCTDSSGGDVHADLELCRPWMTRRKKFPDKNQKTPCRILQPGVYL
jgi:hypothetical protein